MTNFDINHIYDLYKKLTAAQRKQLLLALCRKGMNVSRIEPYEYPEAKGIKHLFFYFENKKDAVPYFLLEETELELFKNVIMEFGL